MSVNSIANLSTVMASSQTNQTVAVDILKRSNDIAKNSVSELLSAIPAPQASGNLPPNLGQNINTQA